MLFSCLYIQFYINFSCILSKDEKKPETETHSLFSFSISLVTSWTYVLCCHLSQNFMIY